MYTSTDLLLQRQNIMKKSLTCLNVPEWLIIPLSTNPMHYIETAYDMHQLIDQPTRVDDKPPL